MKQAFVKSFSLNEKWGILYMQCRSWSIGVLVYLMITGSAPFKE
jgi:hypothetical protein